MTESHALPENVRKDGFFLVLSTGEVISTCNSASQAAEELTLCLDNIPPGHPAPGIYVREGSQVIPWIECWPPA